MRSSINFSSFERYGLEQAAFSESDFYRHLGNRLIEAGLGEVASEFCAAGTRRQFLPRPLAGVTANIINETEAIKVARQASGFQQHISRVTTLENKERLCNIESITKTHNLPWTFSETPYHVACGDWAGKRRLFWLREGVADNVVRLGDQLQKADFGLHFEDAYRPLGVQEGLFKRRCQMARDAHPDWDEADVLLEAKSKTAYTPRLAAHKGGAAIDVRIRDLHTGKLLDLGHNYPDGGALVAYASPFVTQRQWESRFLLVFLAKQSGFSMYPYEDWHICTDDTTAAACNNEPIARYGPIKEFDSQTGQIIEVYQPEELDKIFSSV